MVETRLPGFRGDLSKVNLVLLAAMRNNAFYGHDGSAFYRNDEVRQDQWAYQITRMLMDKMDGFKADAGVARTFYWLVGDLHKKALAQLPSVDSNVWSVQRELAEADRYLTSGANRGLVYFEDQYSIFSNAVALRHVAVAMKSHGLWQWVYREAELLGPHVSEASSDKATRVEDGA